MVAPRIWATWVPTVGRRWSRSHRKVRRTGPSVPSMVAMTRRTTISVHSRHGPLESVHPHPQSVRLVRHPRGVLGPHSRHPDADVGCPVLLGDRHRDSLAAPGEHRALCDHRVVVVDDLPAVAGHLRRELLTDLVAVAAGGELLRGDAPLKPPVIRPR